MEVQRRSLLSDGCDLYGAIDAAPLGPRSREFEFQNVKVIRQIAPWLNEFIFSLIGILHTGLLLGVTYLTNLAW